MPWYKEPWVWFILTPLFVVVIVTSILITIAVKRSDDVVKDDYYKEGRLINWRLSQDTLASQLNVSADILFDSMSGELIVDLSHEAAVEQLNLELSHPSKSHFDHQYPLQLVGRGRYRAELEPLPGQRWYLLLSGVDGEGSSWRLKGKVNLADNPKVNLTPP